MTDFTHSLAILIGVDAYANGIMRLTKMISDVTRSTVTASGNLL